MLALFECSANRFDGGEDKSGYGLLGPGMSEIAEEALGNARGPLGPGGSAVIEECVLVMEKGILEDESGPARSETVVEALSNAWALLDSTLSEIIEESVSGGLRGLSGLGGSGKEEENLGWLCPKGFEVIEEGTSEQGGGPVDVVGSEMLEGSSSK